jgi:predicted RND superfamily exporter protein
MSKRGGRYIAAVIRHRWAVIVTTLLLTALLGYQATFLNIRSDPDSMFPPKHPFVQIDARVRREFGGWHYVLIAVKAKHGDIWDPAVLSVVFDITQDVRLLPGVLPNAIFSLSSPNVRIVEDREGVIEPRYLMRSVPRDAAGLAALRSTVLGEDLLRKGLVSADQTATIVSADFDDVTSEKEISESLQEIARRRATGDVDIFFTGGPVLIHTYNAYIFQVWQRFVIAFGVIACLLYLSFGSLQGVIIPLVSGGLSTMWAIGLMGYVGIGVDQWNTITPILVMSITAGHSTQLLKRYYEELATTADSIAAVKQSFLKVAPVMLAAGLTAALGFASLVAFDVPSLRTFGVFTAFGILCGLGIELSFIPALRCLIPPKVNSEPPLDRVFLTILAGISRSLRRGLHWPYLGVAGLLAAVALAGVFRIVPDFSFIAYLPQGSDGQRNFAAVQRLFPGTLPLTILIEGSDQIAQDPELIGLISALQKHLEKQNEVVYTSSYVDILKQAALAFDSGRPLLDAVALIDRRLAAQLLFLSYSPQYGNFLSRDMKTAVVWAFLREVPTEQIAALIHDVQRFVAARHPPDRWRVRVGGGVAATRVALTEEIVRGKIVNIVVVLTVIFLVSSLILRSLMGGFLVLLPLLFTVLIDLGLLGNLRIPLDPITASVAAMAVGIGADYAIYLIYRMREELAAPGAGPEAIDRAMKGAGRGILSVATAIAGGYLTLAVSSFRAFVLVGMLVSVTMIFSALVSITLLPLLIIRFRPRLIFGAHRTRIA